MNINDFKTALSSGGARANQYRVEMTFPSFVAGGAVAGRKAQFLCTATNLPGTSIGIAPVFYRGRPVKLAGERVIENWQIRVINDADFAIWDSLYSWSNSMNNVVAGTGLTNPLSYVSDMSVHQLDRNDNVLKSFKFIDAWPFAVDPIQLGYSINDQVEEFGVQFAVQHFEVA